MRCEPWLSRAVGPEGLIDGISFRPAKPGDIVTVFVVGAGSDAAATT